MRQPKQNNDSAKSIEMYITYFELLSSPELVFPVLVPELNTKILKIRMDYLILTITLQESNIKLRNESCRLIYF